MGRDENRKQRKRVAKMLSISRCYIAVLWDGVEKAPIAVIDAAALKDQKTPVATAFGNIASGIGHEIMQCIKKNELTRAQLSQLEHAEAVNKQRSDMLQGFLTDEDKAALAAEEAAKSAPVVTPGIVRVEGAEPPPTLPPTLFDASGKTVPFRKKEDKDAADKN
jgi:hypothetical protein